MFKELLEKGLSYDSDYLQKTGKMRIVSEEAFTFTCKDYYFCKVIGLVLN